MRPPEPWSVPLGPLPEVLGVGELMEGSYFRDAGGRPYERSRSVPLRGGSYPALTR